MAILFFSFGLIFGSFFNVCIYRIPRGEGIVFSPSHCVYCKTKLRLFDLIPLFSFLFLKGKCAYCRKKISYQYPLVELFSGIIFLISFLVIGLKLQLIKYLFVFSILIIITIIDLKLQIIPDSLVVLIFFWGFFWQIFSPQINWSDALLGGLIGGGLLLLIALLSKGGMGGGDIKLMFATGFFLGTSLTILSLFIAFITGGVGGGILLLKGKKDRKSPIPFGPFLALGIFLAVLWGQEFIDFYLNLIN